MAVFSEQDRKHLLDYLRQSFDDDNAADMECFAQNFLHNGKVWDLLAEHFPAASASIVKSAMMEAYADWSQDRPTVTTH
ncbi:hypothetical protein CU669_06645 [Paramagnetospirillum kuznetsovii]|uniref:Uncharacterized protein n=1 Tax=Paramagnetospirillum kuznetsovii TaxID=2053833 RepID=A0A364P1E8_9PROT|nr:hypothetical protein [Paramagnetospirillum kuznetsovii]RAU23080.1 hypothetical protein CU669_06645 [Paramagnetospirillum kuznetsovii]